MTPLDRNSLAYNAAVDAVNEADAKIAALAQERDNAWQAAEVLSGMGRHGASHLPRSFTVRNGLVQR